MAGRSPQNYNIIQEGTTWRRKSIPSDTRIKSCVKCASELFAIAERLHEHFFTAGTQRVYTVIKIDDRRDKDVSIGEKVASVERRMGGSSGPSP